MKLSVPGVIVSCQDGREVSGMTAVMAGQSYPNLIEASTSDLRESIRKAEERSAFTYDELAEQASSSCYQSFQARLAWVAVGGLRELLDRAETPVRAASRG